MYTLKQIKDLRGEVNKLNLAGKSILEKYKNSELKKICNGVGPDYFPAWARELVTDLRKESELPAFIHDVEWYESDGSYVAFTASNRRFYENGKLVSKYLYKWYDIRRYLSFCRIYRLYKYCQSFGFGQYKECYSKKCLREGGEDRDG